MVDTEGNTATEEVPTVEEIDKAIAGIKSDKKPKQTDFEKYTQEFDDKSENNSDTEELEFEW